MKKSLDLLSSISALNTSRLVKIRSTRSSSGKVVLYLEHYHKTSREKFYPGVYLTLDKAQLGRDQEMLRYVSLLRDAKEKDILAGGSLKAPVGCVGFEAYARSKIVDKRPANRAGYEYAILSFVRVWPSLSVSDLQPAHVKRYVGKLSHLKPCTVNHYVGALRHVCGFAVKEGLLRINPFSEVKAKKVHQSKEFLSVDELKLLMVTPCQSPAVRDAFLFSCFTGIRLGDIGKLRGSHVVDGYLQYVQSKTGDHERLKLPDYALEIVRGRAGRLLPLPAYKHLRRHLSLWIASAGITKHITFHCARHTFATMMLTLGADIFTVSKLLGHKDVRVTQVYAKLIDEKKDEAMDRLKVLSISGYPHSHG